MCSLVFNYPGKSLLPFWPRMPSYQRTFNQTGELWTSYLYILPSAFSADSSPGLPLHPHVCSLGPLLSNFLALQMQSVSCWSLLVTTFTVLPLPGSVCKHLQPRYLLVIPLHSPARCWPCFVLPVLHHPQPLLSPFPLLLGQEEALTSFSLPLGQLDNCEFVLQILHRY